MTYSVREVDADRCPESRPNPVEVEDSERVTRAFHTGNSRGGIPDEWTFPMDDLAVSRRGAVDHCCGESGGVSVQRTDASSTETLLQQCRDLAAAKPGRQAIGLAVADVSQLRKIATDQVSGRIVFLLADGSAGDRGHAVIRFHPEIRGGLRSKIRKAIIDAFNQNAIVRC